MNGMNVGWVVLAFQKEVVDQGMNNRVDLACGHKNLSFFVTRYILSPEFFNKFVSMSSKVIPS